MKLTNTLRILRLKRARMIEQIEVNIHRRKKSLNYQLRKDIFELTIKINHIEKIHMESFKKVHY